MDLKIVLLFSVFWLPTASRDSPASQSEICAYVVNLCVTELFVTDTDGPTRCARCCNTSRAILDSTGGSNCAPKTNFPCNCESIKHTTTSIPSSRDVTASTTTRIPSSTTRIPASTAVTGTMNLSTEITGESSSLRTDNVKSSTYTIIVLVPALIVVMVVVIICAVIIRRKRICCQSEKKTSCQGEVSYVNTGHLYTGQEDISYINTEHLRTGQEEISYINTEHQYCSLTRLENRNEWQYETLQV